MTKPDSHSTQPPGRPLRLAFMTELYLPSVGGQEIFFQELAETLAARGHSVDVYCIGHIAGLPHDEDINGVHVHRHPNTGRYKRPLIPPLRRFWPDIIGYSARVRKIAAAQRHDFYLLNEFPLLHTIALPKKVRSRSALHWCEIREDPILGTLQTRLPRKYGSNFAISQAVADSITKRSGRPCGVLPSGIERQRYQAAPRSERSGILYVGRLAEHKNLPLLIDAFELAVQQGFTGDLIIAGDGPVRQDIEAYAQRSPLTQRINVLGRVSEEEKVELLSNAEVLAMPSLREGFPRVIAEAMASGLPVVTDDAPENGAQEVVQEYGVGVVCGTEPEEFAKALMAAERGWSEFSEAGLQGSKSLDWSDVADTLEARVRELQGSSR